MSAWVPEAEGSFHAALTGSWEVAPVSASATAPPKDGAFRPITGPMQWQSVPGMEGYFGRAVYRVHFTLPSSFPERLRLSCGGVFYRSRWRLDGEERARQQGYFLPIDFPVRRNGKKEHLLEVNVDYPAERTVTAKRLITGIFSHWDCMPRNFSPGGIWLPVEWTGDPPVRILSARLRGVHVNGSRASGTVAVTVKAEQLTAVQISVRLEQSGQTVWQADVAQELSATTSIALPFSVDPVRLWQPAQHGEPYLYDIVVEVRSDHGEQILRTPCGLRTVALGPGRCLTVNGSRLYVKGINLGPSAPLLGQSAPERIEADLDLALQAGLNLVRVHAHVDHPALYRAADRKGLLVWQDFPLQWLYHRSTFPEAVRQAKAMVHLLGGHPSTALWCMHNEPAFLADTSDTRRLSEWRTKWSILVWNTNRDWMDPRLARAIRREDPDHLTFSHSGVVSRTGKSDSHLYLGWYPGFGPLSSLDPLLRRAPWTFRWVSEFGAQSLPNEETSRDFVPELPSDDDWSRLARTYLAQPHFLDRAIGLAGKDRARLIEDSQAYQAWLIGTYIDRLRVRKYRPNVAVIPFFLRDAVPAITWSLVDSTGLPKKSYFEFVDQMAPVTCPALVPLASGGPARSAALYAVSDRPDPISLHVAVDLCDEKKLAVHRLGEWDVDLAPDGVQPIANLSWHGEGSWLHVMWTAQTAADSGGRWTRLRTPGDAKVSFPRNSRRHELNR